MLTFHFQVLSLVLSDVIGDPLGFIASGPTVPNGTSPQDCLELFHTLGIQEHIPKSIYQVLQQERDQLGERSTNDLRPEYGYDHVHNVIVGSNRMLLTKAQRTAKQLGYVPCVLTSTLAGEATQAGELEARLAGTLCHMYHTKSHFTEKVLNSIKTDFEEVDADAVVDLTELINCVHEAMSKSKPLCVLLAGETVVNVKGKGSGGRNRELALSAAIYWHRHCQHDILDKFNIRLLSMATDGQDGPSVGGAAGAIVDPLTAGRAVEMGLDPQQYLDANDSGSFFDTLDNGSSSVITGLTGTNVMDVQMLFIKPR